MNLFPSETITVRVRAAWKARSSGGSKAPIDGFDIDKEIETSAFDIGKIAMPIKALHPITTTYRFQSTRSELESLLVNWTEVLYQQFVQERLKQCQTEFVIVSKSGHKSHCKHKFIRSRECRTQWFQNSEVSRRNIGLESSSAVQTNIRSDWILQNYTRDFVLLAYA